VASLLAAINDTKLTEQAHAHVRVWFRGHGNERWSLEPGVYRPGFAANEAERIRKERHLTQDFLAMSAPLRDYKSDAEAYFVEQHYRMQTRLLDWSLNPLAAVFFALEPETTAGKIFVLDAYRFRSDPPDRGLCTPRSQEVTNSMHAIFDWHDDKWPDHIFPVRPANIDSRIASQQGCFTFHPPKDPTLTTGTNPTLTEFIVPTTAKGHLRKELELLGVNEFSIYGDLDHLAARLRRAY
jgi:hypothetical protein